MEMELFSRQALLFGIVASIFFYTANGVNQTSTSVEPFLEYHFHTYFDANDREQVAHAIELRNEIIANCVAKKIIAIPRHYHYDPEKPVLEHNNDTTGLNMRPVGPHPIGSFETWVPVEYFAKLYEWFVQKRSPLTIFIHPLTKHELVDHTDRVVFVGKSYVLKTDTLKEVIPNMTSQYEHIKLGYAKVNSSAFMNRPLNCLFMVSVIFSIMSYISMTIC